jgi:hypothetical protein
MSFLDEILRQLEAAAERQRKTHLPGQGAPAPAAPAPAKAAPRHATVARRDEMLNRGDRHRAEEVERSSELARRQQARQAQTDAAIRDEAEEDRAVAKRRAALDAIVSTPAVAPSVARHVPGVDGHRVAALLRNPKAIREAFILNELLNLSLIHI